MVHFYSLFAWQYALILSREAIHALIDDTKKHGPLLNALRSRVDPNAMPIPGEARLKVVALLNDLEMAVWIVHRLAKALALLAS